MNSKIDNAFLTIACDWFGDTDNGLKGAQIIRFCSEYSFKHGIQLAYESMDLRVTKGKNKRTVLLENIKRFDGKKQFEMILALCRLDEFRDKERTLEIQTRLIERYSEYAPDPSELLDISIITETKHLLDDYPEVKKHYESALIKYQAQIFERNLIDDMRFSFELLLKDILSNDRPLEKQQDDLCKFLQTNGISDSLISMYNKLREYYCNYQNIHAKHNDLIKKQELEFIIELTSIMMKLILRVSG
ncbi:MAG: hypothetical protein PHY48_06400 [Candidatus Cloacimonetes bacterium]|nr:hypothetical protein [Candidatus Cloacimonadota bacterium]